MSSPLKEIGELGITEGPFSSTTQFGVVVISPSDYMCLDFTYLKRVPTQFFESVVNESSERNHSSIVRAAGLGLFRYSSERKENLGKLVDMVQTFDNSRKMTPDEISFIKELRGQGESWGRISWVLYDEFGYTWPYYTVMRWSRRYYGEYL